MMDVDRGQSHEPDIFWVEVILVVLNCSKLLAARVEFFESFIHAVATPFPYDWFGRNPSGLEDTFYNVV